MDILFYENFFPFKALSTPSKTPDLYSHPEFLTELETPSDDSTNPASTHTPSLGNDPIPIHVSSIPDSLSSPTQMSSPPNPHIPDQVSLEQPVVSTPAPPLRRSTRLSQQPVWMTDYVSKPSTKSHTYNMSNYVSYDSLSPYINIIYKHSQLSRSLHRIRKPLRILDGLKP